LLAKRGTGMLFLVVKIVHTGKLRYNFKYAPTRIGAILMNFNTVDTIQLLDKINENILVTDDQFNIVFINQSAKQLLAKISPFVGLNEPESFIGVNMELFLGPRQQKVMADGKFPHSAKITLFNNFSAQIVVDQLSNFDGTNNSYIVTWKDVTEFEEALEESRKQIQVLDMPVIPLSVDAAVLVPIMGKLTEDRLALMEDKVLTYCAEHNNEYVIFDFTGVVDELDRVTAYRLQQVINALKLMGVKSIYVGIHPKMARSIVLDGLKVDVKTYNSFVQGIRHVWKETGYELVKL
jgi:rsbT co-antagonist protein RsbR